MNQKSPIEQWRENHLYQIAVSPEVLKLIAEAFQGGRLYEMQPFQKREWVDLTDEDIKSVRQTFPLGGIDDFHSFAKAVLAKAKEKNS